MTSTPPSSTSRPRWATTSGTPGCTPSCPRAARCSTTPTSTPTTSPRPRTAPGAPCSATRARARRPWLMAGRGSGPDFVESLARGLDVLRVFDAHHRALSLAEVATATGLARPTARRLLLTLEELGFVRSDDGAFELTPKVITLGTAYVAALGLWDVARPHLEALVRQTGESSSMAQLDGSDIVYVARVSVPKIIALRVDIGTLSPAPQTSQGKVLLAALPADELGRVLKIPSRSGLPRYIGKA